MFHCVLYCVRCVVRTSEKVCKGTINFALMQIFTVFFLFFTHFANCIQHLLLMKVVSLQPSFRYWSRYIHDIYTIDIRQIHDRYSIYYATFMRYLYTEKALTCAFKHRHAYTIKGKAQIIRKPVLSEYCQSLPIIAVNCNYLNKSE